MPSPNGSKPVVCKDILIYGAGGHAREMYSHVLSIKQFGADGYRVAGFIEDAAAEGRLLRGEPVIAGETFDRDYRECFVTIAIGDPDGRRKIAKRCERNAHVFPALIHPSVDVTGLREIGEGVVIFRGSTLTVDIRIGCHVHVNVGCTISHDAMIGDFVTLSPGVNIAGNVHIGEGAFIGIGASIINGSTSRPLRIGAGSVIAAGACVISDTEPGCLYAGVPARIKKRYC